MNRRQLLAGSAALCLFAPQGRAQAPSRRALVVVFLRGGVDGLAMVPPAEPLLRALRPTLAEEAPLPLGSDFALHSAMGALLPWWEQKRLLVLHAVGQEQPSRSHFEAQDFLESGLAGRRGHDGWLNRALGVLPAGGSFRAVAVQSGMPWSLMGPQPVVAFPALKDFRVVGGAAQSFEQLYASAVDEALKVRGAEAFEGLEVAQGLGRVPPRNGARYPDSPLGRRLTDIARLLHAEVGLKVAVTETQGFDTHLAQRPALGARLRDLAECLAAFAVDLGELMSEVCLLTVTEFGRTARENGTRGTDHGTASAMLALGGGVKGGRVVSDWPGLGPAQLHEERDLRVTLDVRCVLAEALERHLEVPAGEALPLVRASRALFG